MILFFSKTKHFLKVLCFFLYFLQNININAQINLVLNTSFEKYTSCPINNTITNTLQNCPDTWFKPVRGGAYWSSCSNGVPNSKGGVPYNIAFGNSFQYAKTGICYMAMSYRNNDYNDYIQIQLTDSFYKGKKYYGEYYVSLFNPCKYGCNNIGMLFTINAVYGDTVNKRLLLANPQILSYGNPIVTDTLGWVKISGIFTAQGGEQYLTLGNFKSQANTLTKNIQPTGYDGSGYYVDDVAVYSLDSFCLPADAGRDTSISINDSVFIGSYTSGIDTIKWYNASGQVIDSTRPGFWVTPGATGSYRYIVEQTVNGCYSKDTVYVNAILPLTMLNYELRMTNQRQVLNKWETGNEVNVSHFNVQRSTNGKEFTTIGQVKALNNSYNEYSYVDNSPPAGGVGGGLYYRIEGVDKDGKLTYSAIKKLNINHSSLNVTVFPNPTKNLVNINCKEGIKRISLYNLVGQKISQQELRNDDNIKLQTLSLKQLNKGVYVIAVETKNGNVFNEKVVVE